MRIVPNKELLEKVVLKKGKITQKPGINFESELQDKKKEFEESIHLLQRIIKKISDTEERLLSQIKSEMIEMIFAICEKVLRRELRETEDLVNWIESIFQTASPLLAHEKVTVYLSSEDIVKLHPLFSEISSMTIDIKNLNFLADKSLKGGDVRIETTTGLLNATIERHLEVMKRFLIKD